MPKSQQVLIGTAKAAVLLGVNRSTVERMVASERLEPALRGDGRTGAMFFYPSDILALKRQGVADEGDSK